ncbi:hypothetical protein RBH94_09975 [Aestuariibaculum sp. YM273]|uniref:hypothetical protein n=1 Tax=Aestuariibaculum sp. YM273 TaxID=3070659 RepID=UPI0027DBDFC5|nr:hypothetical protein [Aestuariibaculum sp. YM273]WMI64389.1 hypothetical protein RBH94_09975 [Aestuariibaculum sp. YM273]
MRTKWYFGALIVLISFLGIYQNRTSEPNQEIVLQFTDVEVTSDEAHSAIQEVTHQLQTIGADAVQVKQLQNGEVVIAYYSATDVASIKALLAEDDLLQIGYASTKGDNLPSEKDSKTYKFDVFEIHKANDSPSGFGGKHMLSAKQDFDRFYNPHTYYFNTLEDVNSNHTSVEVALKVFREIAVAIDNTTGNIPEVRAGPISLGLA